MAGLAVGLRSRLQKRALRQAPSLTVDTRPERLAAVFGEENVGSAWNLKLEPTPVLLDADDKFGGIPKFRGPEQWPRCKGSEEG